MKCKRYLFFFLCKKPFEKSFFRFVARVGFATVSDGYYCLFAHCCLLCRSEHVLP